MASKKIQITAKLEDGEEYKFDAHNSITIRDVKKILKSLTGISESAMKIQNHEADFTESDENLNDLFPTQRKIEFQIFDEKIAETLEDQTHVYFNLNKFCSRHNNKFPYYYCFTCSKSICSDCRVLSDHLAHEMVDKHDYLLSSSDIVTGFFNDVTEKLNEVLSSNRVIEFDSLKKELVYKTLPGLQSSLKRIQEKLNESLDNFKLDYDLSCENMKKNVFLLKDHCISGLDELKQQLNTYDMMVDENVFLTFDQKVKRLKKERSRVSKDEEKVKQYHEQQKDVVNKITIFFDEIKDFLDTFVRSNVYDDIKLRGKENIISIVTKEEIHNTVLSDIKKKKSSKLNIAGLAKDLNNFANYGIQGRADSQCNRESPFNNNMNNFMTENKSNNTEEQSQVYADIICKCIPNTNQLAVYSDNLKRIEISPLDISELIIPTQQFLSGAACLNHGAYFYISGGELDDESTDSFLKYNHKSKILRRLDDMKYPRHNHSIYYFNDHIYAIGGYHSNTVERYSFNTKKWEYQESMIQDERQHPMLLGQGNYLYAFFGYRTGSYLETVERLNTKAPKAKWEVIPTVKTLSNLGMIGAGIVRISSDEILFLGGRNSQEDKRTTVSFKFSNNTFTPVLDLLLDDPTYFSESLLVNFAKNSWGHFNNSNNSILKIELN